MGRRERTFRLVIKNCSNNIENIEGKEVLLVEVKNSPEKPYFYKGKAYKRIGNSNAYLTRYEGVKLQDILKKRLSVLRNPSIAEILFLSGYIERWGSGIKKMNRLMKEYKLPEPQYEELSGNFLVTFKKKSS